MRCLMLMLTLSFAVLGPSSCTQEQVDSFCQLYEKVVTKGDGQITATPGLKRRLLANELKYRELCAQGAM